MKKQIILTIATILLLCNGCTMISYDRVFPKLAWAWTDQAKEQRRQNREREKSKQFAKEMQKQYGTNWVNEFPK